MWWIALAWVAFIAFSVWLHNLVAQDRKRTEMQAFVRARLYRECARERAEHGDEAV